jgi:hypothetical protein
VQPGWVQATSSTIGLQAFWLGGDFTNVMDGAEASPVARELVFPLVTQQTELSVANIAASSNTVTIRLYSSTGGELAAAIRTIQVNGAFRNTVTTLFPPALVSTGVHIRVTGTGNITGTTKTEDFPVGPSWVAINGVDSSRQVTELSFPHVVSGLQGTSSWTSIVGITNLTATSQSVTITFTPSAGDAVSVARVISGRGSLRESVPVLFGFSTAYQEGWVRITSVGSMAGFVAYGYGGPGASAAVPAQSTPYRELLFAHIATGTNWGTGLALLNANTTAANIEVYVLRSTGAVAGFASFTLPGSTKLAKELSDLVAQPLAEDGFVLVRSTNNVPVYGIQLFYTRDLKVLSNISAGTIDPRIVYIPPPLP